MDEELYYIAFILGYDLLHHYIVASEDNETDIAFNKCVEIAKQFRKSEEYNTNNCSLYESLENWLVSKNYL